MNTGTPPDSARGTAAGERLAALLAEAALPALDPIVLRAFESYLALLLRWNSRINLTAIRDEDGILKRHFVESIACACALPENIATLLDFGSGAGFPGIPIALCRPSTLVTLAESQSKKAAFLQEAVRVLGLSTKVHGARADGLAVQFDCVTLRAVDRMSEAVTAAGELVSPGGYLAVMTTQGELRAVQSAAGPGFRWDSQHPLPGSEVQVPDGRILAIATRV